MFAKDAWLTQLENRHQQVIQLGLERVNAVALQLDLLKPKATVITVAGTNGKGSTVALIEAIYHVAGYRVASYTSPHLHLFNERIRVNNCMITDAALVEALKAIDACQEAQALTYFEMTTLAALWHFKRHALDVIILEVGLGGRLDATNIIDADLAIITTIALDHEAYLGTNLEAIAVEKAGIIRKNKPVIYADYKPPKAIIKQAATLSAPLYIKGEAYDGTRDEVGYLFSIAAQQHRRYYPDSPLHENSVAAAIMASMCLENRLPVHDNARERAIRICWLAGRTHIVDYPQLTLFDVAHNPQAAERLADYIGLNYPQKRIHAVFSALADKDIQGLISPMIPLIHHWHLAPVDYIRTATFNQLTAPFSSTDVFSWYTSPQLAYHAACTAAGADDLIVVYGSFFTVGAILRMEAIQDSTHSLT